MTEIQWQKWEKETFEKAKTEKKPVFLWIEYPGCDACRKMKDESFSNLDLITKLNHSFVPIKVSNDERPDIDRHFQRVFQTMTGKQTGWPLSIFIDYDFTPLYATAYVPNESRDGMMGLGEMLDLIAEKYANDLDTLRSKGKEVLAQLVPRQKIEATKIDITTLGNIFSRQAIEAYDEENKGFGESPKYLRPVTMQAILAWCDQGNEMQFLQLVTRALDTMLDSPIWDDEKGAFYCCTYDAAWQNPKKQKNLTENALMIVAMLRAGILKGKAKYIEAAYRIGEWTLSQMRDDRTGLFYASVIGNTIDKKIILSSNALMATALVRLAEANDRFRPDALGTLNAIMEQMTTGPDLKHQLGSDTEVTFMEDYAALAEALIAADEMTGNHNFSLSASEIANAAIRRFYNNGFWGVGDGDFGDPEGFKDGSLPSFAATMALVLGSLSKSVDKTYAQFANQTLQVTSYDLMRYPIRKAKMTEAALLYYEE